MTEEITDATGTVLYKPCITTADGSVWEHTITGIIQESKAQQSENWITIKNYRADAVPEQKDITVQKQWDDSIQHPDYEQTGIRGRGGSRNRCLTSKNSFWQDLI